MNPILSAIATVSSTTITFQAQNTFASLLKGFTHRVQGGLLEIGTGKVKRKLKSVVSGVRGKRSLLVVGFRGRRGLAIVTSLVEIAKLNVTSFSEMTLT